MAEWLLPGDRRWQEMLREVEHDFYHLPCYADVMAENEDGTPRAYYDVRRGGALLIPLLLRRIPWQEDDMRWFDAVSPYGYASPVCHDEISGDELKMALSEYFENGANAGLVTTFLRLHPLLSERVAAAMTGIGNAAVIASGETVSIDLTQTESQLDKQLSVGHRRNIRILRTSGFTASVDGWNDYPTFRQLYLQTMQRLNAGAFYRFGEAYFRRLRECLDGMLHICAIRNPAGDVVCGGLFTRVGRVAQYHLGATADGYGKHAPSKLMLFTVRNWAKSAGAEIFHLGGGVGGKRDSLFEFKNGFATHAHPFQTVRIVHNESMYREMTRHWMMKAGVSTRQDEDYFPSYRRSAIAE
jgi:hypothetical protein